VKDRHYRIDNLMVYMAHVEQQDAALVVYCCFSLKFRVERRGACSEGVRQSTIDRNTQVSAQTPAISESHQCFHNSLSACNKP
jgi:hypothetical protein